MFKTILYKLHRPKIYFSIGPWRRALAKVIIFNEWQPSVHFSAYKTEPIFKSTFSFLGKTCTDLTKIHVQLVYNFSIKFVLMLFLHFFRGNSLSGFGIASELWSSQKVGESNFEKQNFWLRAFCNNWQINFCNKKTCWFNLKAWTGHFC